MSRILVVDDNETMRSGVASGIERMGHEVVAVGSGGEALKALQEQSFDLVITDYRMDDIDGLAVLEKVKEHSEETDVILITAFATIEIAVETMKKGAVEFIPKPFSLAHLRLKVEKVLEHRATRQERERLDEENRYLRAEIGGRYGQIVGNSIPMKKILATVEKVAPTDSAVLIYGESGTGKELFARAIHNRSHRCEGPFVKINCGALPRELVESELFGHERGAFTGAVRRKKGRFELAQGGTIFLDEIGDVPPEMQGKLLRVLQEKEFDPVGGERTLRADVRVVAATNRPLKQRVEEGTFREDLFYRLEVIPLHLPPLRERKEDIPQLVAHFLEKKCQEIKVPLRRLTDKALQALENYSWPGNVRELENVIERTIVLSDAAEVELHDLPLSFAENDPRTAAAGQTAASGIPLNRMLDELEKELIGRAMEQSRGVKTRAAEILGIKTSALYYKLDKYKLE